MNAIKSKISALHAQGTARPSLKAAPGCEAMEGRQLLNGAWGVGGPGLDSGHLPPADHHGIGGGGMARNFTPPALSASARAAMTQLQADRKTLDTEVQADATVQADQAAVQADQKAIAAALGLPTPTRRAWTTPTATSNATAGQGFGPGADPGLVAHFKGRGPGGPLGRLDGATTPGGTGTGTAPTLPAALSARLTAAGISTTTVTNDMTKLQTDMKAVDPTLQARVQADEAALQAAMPASAMHFDHILNSTTTTTSTSTSPGTSATN
jgi:hypothetical protein